MNRRFFPFIGVGVLAVSVTIFGCNRSGGNINAVREAALREKAQALETSHSSVDHCREVLGAPDWVSEIDGFVVWRYKLPKEGAHLGNWLTLMFDATSLELQTVSTLFVDSFEGPSNSSEGRTNSANTE